MSRKSVSRGKLKFVILTLMIALLIGCPGSTTTPPPSKTGPTFVINSPTDNAQVAGSFFFSAQPFDMSEVERVRFSVDGTVVGTDTDASDGFKLPLRAVDYDEGRLTLQAEVTGKNGGVSTNSITVRNVPNPPSSTTVGAEGAVLGTKEPVTGGLSTLSIRSGEAEGARVSFEARTKEQVKTDTGVDYDALGVTFLGAQEIDASQEVDGLPMVSSGGWGPAVQPGQAVVNYQIIPDQDGDGNGELVVVNTASVTPNGDVVSDPVSVVQIEGEVNVRRGQQVKIMQASSGISGPPGTFLEFEATGFNPAVNSSNIATFTDSIGRDFRVFATFTLNDANGNVPGLLRVMIPPYLSIGPTNLVLRNESTDLSLEPIQVFIEKSEELDRPAIEIIDAFMSQSIAFNTSIDLPSNVISRLEQMRAAFLKLASLPETETEPEVQKEIEIFLNSFAAAILEADIKSNDLQMLQNSNCISEAGKELGEDLIFLTGLAGGAVITLAGIALGISSGGLGAAGIAAAATISGAAVAGATSLALNRLGRIPICPLRDPQPPPLCPPGGGGNSSSTITGMGSAPPPGGNGCGNPIIRNPLPGEPVPPDDPTQPERRMPYQIGNVSKGVVVKVFSNGAATPFSGLTDAGGYFFIPFIPADQPFTAIATDIETGEVRQFEGMGPKEGESVYIYFDFLDEADGLPTLLVNTNRTVTLNSPELYEFDATEGDQLNLAIINKDMTGRVGISISDIRGNVVAQASLGQAFAETGIFTVPETGTYTVNFNHSGAPGDYHIGLARIEDPIPIGNTVPLANISSNLEILGDHQFYSFEGTQGDLMSFGLDTSVSADSDFIMTVSQPDEARIADLQADSQFRASEHVRLSETGRYLIEIESRHGDPTGTTLEENTGAWKAVVFEPESQAVGIDTNSSGTLEPGDFSVYDLEASPETPLNLSALAETGILIDVYDAQGNKVINSVSPTAFKTTNIFTVPEAGTYAVVVDPSNLDSLSYTLGVASIQEPTSFTLSLPMELDESLNILGDVQFHSFEGTQGTELEFILSHPESSSLQAKLLVYSPDTSQPFYSRPLFASTLPTGNAGARSRSTGPVTLPSTGEYIVAVQSLDINSIVLDERTGGYTITIANP